jgi:hypothetical protein
MWGCGLEGGLDLRMGWCVGGRPALLNGMACSLGLRIGVRPGFDEYKVGRGVQALLCGTGALRLLHPALASCISFPQMSLIRTSEQALPGWQLL